MEEVVILEEDKPMVFEQLENGKHFLLNAQGPIYRKVIWPGEKSYVIDVEDATVHMETEFLGKPVIPLAVKEPLRLKKAK